MLRIELPLPGSLVNHDDCGSSASVLVDTIAGTGVRISLRRSGGSLGNMQQDQITDSVHLGTGHFFEGERPLRLHRADRRQHVFLCGKSGTGKTSLLRSLVLQDIEAGEGVALIDPHGDLAADLLNHIPPRRIDHVVYFNPADLEHPLAFNLLRASSSSGRHLIASGIVGAFKSIWSQSWGPRLEYLLYNCVATLLDCDNATIMGVPRLLVDEGYREWAVRQCKDPVVRAFWQREFAGFDKRLLAEVISPVQNKLGQLLTSAPIRNILGQVKSKIDPRFIMDNQRIFIANLSKGLLGDDKANLLGALLVSQFQSAAMARADVPENQRRDFNLFIDEFHSFTTDSFVSMLSEIRKYRLGLTLAGQYLDQATPEIRSAVFGNVGSLVAFRVGESDAITLAREFGAHLDPSLFSGLANFQVVTKLLRDGFHGEPILGTTQQMAGGGYGCRDNIIARCRQRYCTPRHIVEDRIRRWMRVK